MRIPPQQLGHRWIWLRTYWRREANSYTRSGLTCNLLLEIPPAESMELRGSLKRGDRSIEEVRVLPRSREWLPEHVEVVSSAIIDLPGQQDVQVYLKLRNCSRHHTARVTSQDVLAELVLTGPSSDSVRPIDQRRFSDMPY